jgi:hypothetical protein
LKTWILLSEHISRGGSFCILTMLRYKNKPSYGFKTFSYVFMTIIFNIEIATNHLNCGTRFPFQCQCELPESYEAYRKQQHRWHSGPMQLFRLCFMDIIKSKVLHLISVFSCKYTWLSFSCH